MSRCTSVLAATRSRVAAVGQALEAVEHDGGARAVANEPLASAVVALLDVDARVEVEAVLGARVTTVAALGREACVAVVVARGAGESDERSVV